MERFLKKTKVELLYDPTTPILSIPGGNLNLQSYMHPSVYRSTICNSQTMGKNLNVHQRGMDKDVGCIHYIHAHMPTHTQTQRET